MNKQSNGSDSGLKTVAVGVAAGVVGAAVGATVAAMSDEKTRNKVMDVANKAKDKGMEIMDAVQERADETKEKVMDVTESAKQKGKQITHEVKK